VYRDVAIPLKIIRAEGWLGLAMGGLPKPDSRTRRAFRPERSRAERSRLILHLFNDEKQKRPRHCLCLLPSSSDGNWKPPAIPDRHKAEPKTEQCANGRSHGGRTMKHLPDHHDSSASQGGNGVKIRA
jgi:hypothetical protein